jgi:hypothetical protein
MAADKGFFWIFGISICLRFDIRRDSFGTDLGADAEHRDPMFRCCDDEMKNARR